MAFVIDTLSQLLLWLKGEPVISAALALLLLGPGSVCCWLAHHIAGVRLVPAGGPAWSTRTNRHADRLEARMASLSTALRLLTDSTESALKDAFNGLERLSGAIALAPEARTASPERLIVAKAQGRTARDIAIAEGLSEAEVSLRLRLQQYQG